LIRFGPIPLRLCVALLVGHVAFTGNRLILTLHASAQHATPLQIGVLLGLLMAGPMVLSVQFGRWSDRMGYEKLCAVGLSLVFGANLLSAVAAATGMGLLPMYLASLMTGSGYMLAHVAVNNAIGKLTPSSHTAEAFSVLAMSLSLSGLLGPLVSGLAIDHIGFRNTYIALAGFALTSGMLMRWAARRYHVEGQAAGRHKRGRIGDLLSDPKLRAVFVISSLLSMAWDLFNFLAPLHGVRSGLSATATGMVVASFSVGTFAVRLLLPALSRVAGVWRILGVALVLTAAGFVAFPLLRGVWQLAGAAFVIGMSLGCAQPLSMALVYRTAPAHRVGEAAGFRIAITSFSQTALPMFFGALGAAVGFGPAFWVVSVVLAAGVSMTERQRRANSIEGA
jgi:MFS family permease